jgi:hypothetical protein
MGREPTSTGCHTCRRRHIKCDETRPSCRRCQRSGYTCDGYESVLRIQNHGVNSNTTTSTSHPRKISRASSHPSIQSWRTPTGKGASRNPAPEAPLQVATLRSGLVQSLPNSGASTSRGPTFLSPHEHANSIGPLMQEPSLNPFVDNITLSYFFEGYSWINVHSILLQDTPMRQHLAQLADQLTYNSLRALAYGIFGRDHHIVGLRQSAAHLYGASLSAVQSRLQAASKSELAFMIKPIVLMGSYSVCQLALLRAPPSLLSILSVFTALIADRDLIDRSGSRSHFHSS